MRAKPVQHEDREQRAVIEWCGWNRAKFPVLDMLYHTPNGKRRDPRVAAILKSLGVKAGVPDLCLPAPRRGYMGLYIEMKYGNNTMSTEQKSWIRNLTEEGYLAIACYGASEAIDRLLWYINGEKTRVVA